jgi:hypothetical protein
MKRDAIAVACACVGAVGAVGSLASLAACSRSAPPSSEDHAPADKPTLAPIVQSPNGATHPPLPPLTGLLDCHVNAAARMTAVAAAKPAHERDVYALPFKLGPCPAIPPQFGGVTFGADEAAMKKAIPSFKKVPVFDGATWMKGEIVIGTPPFTQAFVVDLKGDGTARDFEIDVDAAGFAALEAAWGKPLASVDALEWLDPATKVRAIAEPRDALPRANPKTRAPETVAGYHITFAPYVPLADVLSPTGFLAKPLLHKTDAELAALYPGLVDIEGGPALDPALEAQFADTPEHKAAYERGMRATIASQFKLPPVETDVAIPETELVILGGDREMTLRFGDNAQLDAELLARVVASLGEPIAYDATNAKYTFTGQAPDTLVDLEHESHDWLLTLRAK